ADAAEARARAIGFDGDASTWVVVHLQRFLEQLRMEADRDAHAVLDIAAHRARLRVADARAEALLGDLPELVDVPSASEPVEAPPRAAEPAPVSEQSVVAPPPDPPVAVVVQNAEPVLQPVSQPVPQPQVEAVSEPVALYDDEALAAEWEA